MSKLSILLLIMLLILGCQANPDADERFWTWFESHATELRDVEMVTANDLAADLSAALRRVHPDLVFELGGAPGEPRDFIVSADGIKAAFPAVEKLVGQAPEMEGWSVIAFRPRIGTQFSITYDGFTLSPDSLWFAAEAVTGRIELSVHCPGVGSQDEKLAIGASFVLLDAALGEFDVVTSIGTITHQRLPRDPRSNGLRPLSELPTMVDSFYKVLP